MLINEYVHDLCWQATAWTILEQLTLLQHFHEVIPHCMLKLYHVSVVFVIVKVIISKLSLESR